jgi:y4mF family transcriptional regulator
MSSLELWSSALVARRKGLGLTQQQLADLSGVGVAFLYDLEHAKPTVRIDKLLAVLEVLGLQLELTEGRSPIGVASKLTGEE